MWVGRDKLNDDNSIKKKNARCVERGDIHSKYYHVTANQSFSPTPRTCSMSTIEAVGCLRGQHCRPYDVPGAYLQGVQKASEQVLLIPPPGFRFADERGVKIYWLTNNPLYGQADAGAIWNRTANDYITTEGKLPRCPQEPGVYSCDFGTNEDGRVTNPLYVDDGRVYFDPTDTARREADRFCAGMTKRFKVEFEAEDPVDDYFLGANRVSTDRNVVSVRATTYIRTMLDRYVTTGSTYRPTTRLCESGTKLCLLGHQRPKSSPNVTRSCLDHCFMLLSIDQRLVPPWEGWAVA
eukprot:7387168-Prymnesium_polylepis.1